MVKLVALIKKLDHLSKEEFDDYWRNVHGGIFMSNPIAQRTVLSYHQTHLVKEHTDAIVAKFGAERAAPRQDGIVEFHFKNMEDLFETLESDYYKNVVIPDEEKFIKTVELYIAEAEPIWQDGKPGKGVIITQQA